MNDGDQALSFIYLLLLLVMIGSAFSIRRLLIGQSLKMFAAWALIFGAVFIGFTLKDDFSALGRRVLAEGRGDAIAVPQGETMRIRQSDDGHFWVEARLNGKPVRFLVDSGATTTSISVATAHRAGI
ncbi:MAG TPA: aspartyl protease family protein, partial [Allosphingosinicella sp.]